MSNLFRRVLEAEAGVGATAVHGDFHKDGLIYCGKCRKPKEMLIKLFEDRPAQLVPINCECAQKTLDDMMAEGRRQQRINTVHNMLEQLQAFGAADFPEARLSMSDNRNAWNNSIVTRYIDRFENIKQHNIGLLLWGECGCGKTFLAECVVNGLLDQGYYAWMTSVRAVQAAIDAKFGEQRAFILQQIRHADVMVLDDYGTERGNDYMQERVYEVINERYKAGKPTIITTNLDPKELANGGENKDISAKRINQRILEMCSPVHIEGGSRRKAEAATKMQTMKEIFGMG